MKPEIAVGRHGDARVLERPPFAVEYADLIIIDRLAENRSAQRNFIRGQRAASQSSGRSFGRWCSLAGIFYHRINLDPVIVGKDQGHFQQTALP